MQVESADHGELIFENGWMKRDDLSMDVRIRTQDLELRSVKMEDLSYYLALFSDPETMKLYTDNEIRLAKLGVEAWKTEQMTNIARRVNILVQRWKEGVPFSAFAIYRGDDFVGHVVAGFGDNPGESEIAYIIRAEEWNKGYASQAVEALVQKWLPYLQKMGYETADDNGVSAKLYVVVAFSRPDNVASNRILEKNEFEKVDEKELYGFVRYHYRKKL